MGGFIVNKFMKNTLSFIISLLIMFLIFVSSISMISDKVVLNQETYISIMAEDNTIDKIKQEIDNNLNYLLISNNIPSGTFDEVILKNEIAQHVYDTMKFTISFMKNNSEEIPVLDTEVYKKRIDEKINKFIEENIDNIGYEFYGTVDEFKKHAINIIDNYLQVIDMNQLSKSSMIKMIAAVSSLASNNKLYTGVAILVVLLSLIHFVIWRGKGKSRRFAWSAYPFISAGTVLALVGWSGYLSKFYENIPISIEYIKSFSICTIKIYLISFTYIGIAILVLGIIIMSLYWKHLFKIYYRNSN